MRHFYPLLLSSSLLLFSTASHSAASIVELQTNLGTITVKLDYTRAPISSKNFIDYVNSGFYKNTLFHRVIKDFMIQGGGVDKNTFKGKTTYAPIALESNNGLKNLKGTIAMARTSDPDSATSGFFINTVDNNGTVRYNLDYIDATNPGYAVFGSVIKGMELVTTIGNSLNSSSLYSSSNLPIINEQLVYIDNAYSSTSVDTTHSKTRITLNGSGKVVSSPSGINCGTACVLTTSINNSTVKLTATAASGYTFSGWRGDCKGYSSVISLKAVNGVNHNCTASFIKAPLAIQ
jgi:cyclophilin family peptidyl-prolyl cis-trans isomerase